MNVLGADLYMVTLPLCGRCIEGEGGECHTPGCSLYMNRAPDLSIRHRAEVRSMPTGEEKCGRLLVGQGDDTYDPKCVLPAGHGGLCRAASHEGEQA
jgi:hypothetical protein